MDSSICEAFACGTYQKTRNLHPAVSEKLKQEDDDLISGAKKCSPSCLFEGSEFDEADVFETVFGEISLPEECQLRCQSTPSCTAYRIRPLSQSTSCRKNHAGMKKAEDVMIGGKYCGGACDVRGFHSPHF